MPAFTDLTIKTYSAKSFVVIDQRGRHEDSLLSLGGKKNGCLTDKDTGDRFEGYIYPTSRLDKVKAWQSAGKSLQYTKPVDSQENNYTSEYSSSNSGGQQSRQLLLTLEKTQAEVKWLRSVVLQIAEHSGLEIEEEVEEAVERPKPTLRRPRLL